MMSGDKGISAFPDGDDVFSWIGTIIGPQGTVSKKISFVAKFFSYTQILLGF